MLAAVRAEVVTHTFVPEVFLAKELQLCYVGICYVVNYAETGSRHRPFVGGDLFGGLAGDSDDGRLAGAVGAMSHIVAAVAAAVDRRADTCECHNTLAGYAKMYNLPEDWRAWFA